MDGRGVGTWSRAAARISVAVAAMTAATAATAQDLSSEPDGSAPATVEDLRALSIEQLADIQVTSVARRPQRLADAPAAIYVIDHDDIVRSGALTLPEILRLAPNLQVAQTGAGQYVITARGFNGAAADQSFANKLLVLIDGRTVYSPMFSGVYWDMQDVVVEDIDRIEVVSGPGATMWGANAVNGVINIVTRASNATQGGYVDIAGGNLQQSLTVRYGGRITDQLTGRLYFKDLFSNAGETSTGANAHDAWSKPQGGFRLDWSATRADTLTLQGDAYGAAEAHLAAPNEDLAGRDLLARWDHRWANGSDLQVQTYYDFAERTTQDQGGSFHVDTYDLDLQDSFTLGSRHQITWGGGARVNRYAVTNAASLLFVPSKGELDLYDAFAQDTVTLSRALSLVVGLKLEDDPYSGLSALPEARLSWRLDQGALAWLAVSRAVRSPTPFDRDVVEKFAGRVYLTGDAGFLPETLTAYEIGARAQPWSGTALSVSAYFNRYDDLRSIQPAPASFFPLMWYNGIRGDTWGVETWADHRISPGWRLSASFNAMFERFTFKPGASDFIGAQQVADDPRYQASLQSSWNLGREVTLDAFLRYVSALPNPAVPAYVELNTSLGWNVSRHIRLGLSGLNLLHARHQELPAPGADAVSRSVVADLRWRF